MELRTRLCGDRLAWECAGTNKLQKKYSEHASRMFYRSLRTSNYDQFDSLEYSILNPKLDLEEDLMNTKTSLSRCKTQAGAAKQLEIFICKK